MSSSLEDMAAHHLEAYRRQPNENTLMTLLELGSGVIPILVREFDHENDTSMRETLVELIWQQRTAEAV